MLGTIIDRLTSAAVPPLRSVAGAEALGALKEGTAPRHGDTFVIPFRQSAEPNSLAAGGFRQRVDVAFLVAIVIRRADDAKGGERASSFDEFQSVVEGALAGWEPTPDSIPCELVESNAGAGGSGVTWLVSTWRTDRYLEA